eukprot:13593569-Alexandrium_andersonii.AAC.1
MPELTVQASNLPPESSTRAGAAICLDPRARAGSARAGRYAGRRGSEARSSAARGSRDQGPVLGNCSRRKNCFAAHRS